MNWRRHSANRIPSMPVDSVGNDAAGNPQLGRPVSDAHRFTVCCDQAGAPLVPRLIPSGRPAAVGRLVMTVAVDALKGQPGRALSHVCQKAHRAFQPRVADANASPTIVWKLFVRWILAPRFHVDPCVVLLSSRQSMCQIGCGGPFFLQAPAGLNRAGTDMQRADYLGSTAVAGAIPVVGGSALLSKAGDGQAANTQAGAINKFRHFFTSIMAINHCWVRSNRVIEFPLSAAKPSCA